MTCVAFSSSTLNSAQIQSVFESKTENKFTFMKIDSFLNEFEVEFEEIKVKKSDLCSLKYLGQCVSQCPASLKEYLSVCVKDESVGLGLTFGLGFVLIFVLIGLILF